MSFNLDEIIANVRGITEHSAIRKITRHFSYRSCLKLYVVIPYWTATMSQFPMQVLTKRILNAGYSCLIYQFPKRILSDNIYLTQEYFKEIQEEIKQDIKDIKKKHNFEEISVIGISLGCVNALMVANKNPDINNVFLVVPGDSLSDSLWRGVGTVRLKSQIKKHKINLEELEKEWKNLDPKNNIDSLFDKKIEIHLSKSDKVIPYTNGHRLVADMEETGLHPSVFTNNKLGHYLTFLKFIFFNKF